MPYDYRRNMVRAPEYSYKHITTGRQANQAGREWLSNGITPLLLKANENPKYLKVSLKEIFPFHARELFKARSKEAREKALILIKKKLFFYLP